MKKVLSLAMMLVVVMFLCSCAEFMKELGIQDSKPAPAQTSAVIQQDAPSPLKGLTTKVANFMAAKGKKSTLAQINDPQGIFTMNKIFAFVIDPRQNGKIIASADKSLLNKDINTKDGEGNFFIKDITKLVASGKEEGNWLYTWNKKLKSCYFQKVKNLIVVASE